MKVIPKQDLIIRDSFKLPFAGGEIWYEELDALSVHADIVREKFLKDMETIRKPSSPSFIVIHLDETQVDQKMAALIVCELSHVERPLIKIAFVGLGFRAKIMFRSSFKRMDHTFCYKFMSDLQKAKEWLLDA